MRFTLEGEKLAADTECKNEGRGFYLCPDKKCIDSAVKRKAFNRACRMNVDADSIEKAIEIALDTKGGSECQ